MSENEQQAQELFCCNKIEGLMKDQEAFIKEAEQMLINHAREVVSEAGLRIIGDVKVTFEQLYTNNLAISKSWFMGSMPYIETKWSVMATEE